MSEEFNTSDDFFSFDDSPEPAAQPEQPTEPAPVQGIDPSEFQTLKQELESLRQWKQDASRIFSGDSQQRQQGMSREEMLLNLMVQDPIQYAQIIASQAVSAVKQESAAQALDRQFTEKYPQLSSVKDAIYFQASQVFQQAQESGQRMTEQEALEKVAGNFLTQFSPKSQTGEGKALQHLALSTGGGTPAGTAQNSQSPNIWSMSDSEFEAFDRQVKQGFYNK